MTSAAEFRAVVGVAPARATPSPLLVYDPSLKRARDLLRSCSTRRIMKPRILVIDDEPAIRDTMRMILEYDGHECSLAGSGPEGLTMAERESPDLVFLDIKMPGLDGLEVLSRLRGTNETLPVVIVSAHGTAATALEAGRLGAFRFIEKPLSKDYVLDAVREGRRARARCGARTGTLRIGARDAASAGRRERAAASRSWTRCGARRRPTRRC